MNVISLPHGVTDRCAATRLRRFAVFVALVVLPSSLGCFPSNYYCHGPNPGQLQCGELYHDPFAQPVTNNLHNPAGGSTEDAAPARPFLGTGPSGGPNEDDSQIPHSTPPRDRVDSLTSQSDPVDTPQPGCSNVSSTVKATAVVKHEPASPTRPAAPPFVLDIELTVVILPNPNNVTFASNRLTIAGGVLVEERFQATDPTKDVLLIRPIGAVAREASFLALFGVVCKTGHGYLRVPMSVTSPMRDGDKVSVSGIQGS